MRTIVLLNKNKEQVTNSRSTLGLLDVFPQTGTMPSTLAWDGLSYGFLDQIISEEDTPGDELYRYVEV
jgi:hypothetical protein